MSEETPKSADVMCQTYFSQVPLDKGLLYEAGLRIRRSTCPAFITVIDNELAEGRPGSQLLRTLDTPDGAMKLNFELKNFQAPGLALLSVREHAHKKTDDNPAKPFWLRIAWLLVYCPALDMRTYEDNAASKDVLERFPTYFSSRIAQATGATFVPVVSKEVMAIALRAYDLGRIFDTAPERTGENQKFFFKRIPGEHQDLANRWFLRGVAYYQLRNQET